MESGQSEKTGPNQTVESGPVVVNKTGYDERPAQYMANPMKKFWEVMSKIMKGRYEQ